ncbi:hypothetical protein B0H13DRAFT_2119329, partial [Mycena leptocephala]
MLGARLSTTEADSYGYTSSSFGLQLTSTNEPTSSLERESCTHSSLRARAVLICPITSMDAVARCLGRVLRPTSKDGFHGGEFASGEEVLGRKYWRRAKAAESTSGSSADVHVVCVCGGNVEEGRVVRRRVLASPMRTQQFSSTQDDPTGPSAAASSFSAMREEGETSAKRSGTAEGGRQ